MLNLLLKLFRVALDSSDFLKDGYASLVQDRLKIWKILLESQEIGRDDLVDFLNQYLVFYCLEMDRIKTILDRLKYDDELIKFILEEEYFTEVSSDV